MEVLKCSLIFGLTWLVGFFANDFVGYHATGILFLVIVGFSATFLNWLSVVALAVALSLIHNFYFIPPTYTFAIGSTYDALWYFAAIYFIGNLTARLARKEKETLRRENRALSLYSLANDIAEAKSEDDVVSSGVKHLKNVIGDSIEIVLNDTLVPSTKESIHSAPNNDKRDYLSSGWVSYQIRGRSMVLGSLVIQEKLSVKLDIDQKELIETVLHQIAVGLERERYREQARNLMITTETEKLYKLLLDSVSHELKTPISAIKGSASALIDPASRDNWNIVEELGIVIHESSERLERLVESLLNMTRVDSGTLKPKRETLGVREVVGTAIVSSKKEPGKHQIVLDIPDETPPIVCDPVLLNQALKNILRNAYLYTSGKSTIEISVCEFSNEDVRFAISDNGPGLPKDDPEQVLQKFHRGSSKKTGGLGLGLAIAKGFIEAQGGSLNCNNNPKGGAIFVVAMPRGATS